MKHSMMIVLAAALSLAATPATASISASYGSDTQTPAIGDSNDFFETDYFSVPSSVPDSGSIDHVTWAVGDYGLSNDSIAVELCVKGEGSSGCTGDFTGYKGSTSQFSGRKATTVFYLKIKIKTDVYQRFQSNYTSRQQTHLEVYY